MSNYTANALARLTFKLVEKGTLTFAEAQEILEITDADMLGHRPAGMPIAEDLDKLAAMHQRDADV
jgi:hypothetical protein